MKFTVKHSRLLLLILMCSVLLADLGHASTPAQRFESGKKAKVTGTIVSRNGDLITLKVKKSNSSAMVNISDSTIFDREKPFRLRPASMDATAMVPGLTITTEGIGTLRGSWRLTRSSSIQMYLISK
jgi:hypothetical protein